MKAAEAGGYSSAIRGEAGRNPSLLELPFNQVYPLLLDLGEKKSEGEHAGEGGSSQALIVGRLWRPALRDGKIWKSDKSKNCDVRLFSAAFLDKSQNYDIR